MSTNIKIGSYFEKVKYKLIYHYIGYLKRKPKISWKDHINLLPIEYLEIFDEESYLFVNQDVLTDIENGKFSSGLEHLILYGIHEVREGKRQLGTVLPFMSEREYLKANPDVKESVRRGDLPSGLWHFLAYGIREFLEGKGRKLVGIYPFHMNESLKEILKERVDFEAFLDANPDILEKNLLEDGQDITDYFFQKGIEEIRMGNRTIHPDIPQMSEIEYVSRYGDIMDAMQENRLVSPFEQFLLYGYHEILEGRRAIRETGMNGNYSYRTPLKNDAIRKEIESFETKPLISVVMPVYNVEVRWLQYAIASLQSQWYTNWELCIADDHSCRSETVQFLKQIDDPKIKITFLEKNMNISGASNAALKLVEGDYIALMDNDDELTPDAFYEIVKIINEKDADFIYSDEDKIEVDGSFAEPHYKPDFSPDMFLSQNYISHLSVIKTELVKNVGGWEVGLEGSQDYDLYLKVLEHTKRIVHIPKILYHWRKVAGSTAAEFNEKSYAQEAGRKALENAMKRRNISAKVENGRYPGTYRVKYTLHDMPLVSIVIPFKDKPELLRMCIGSILKKSTYKNFEIIGISNNSQEKETFRTMGILANKDKRVHFIEYNFPFNYSSINNYAVRKYARGKHIVLLNNDIEIITPGWIEALLEFSQRDDVGAVGAKLYYPDDSLQHAGVILGLGGVAGHSHKYFSKLDAGYFFRPHIVQNLSAVTAACLMVKKELYINIGGLNESDLQVAFNDVDFCLRLREEGYLNVYTPFCEAYHHESISRGQDDSPEKIERFSREIEYMRRRHKKLLTEGDPYYNTNLTLNCENFGLKA